MLFCTLNAIVYFESVYVPNCYGKVAYFCLTDGIESLGKLFTKQERKTNTRESDRDVFGFNVLFFFFSGFCKVIVGFDWIGLETRLDVVFSMSGYLYLIQNYVN